MDSDDDLVLKAQRGDDKAFDALVNRHRMRISRLCTRMLENAQEGEQAAQDTFLQAWRYREHFRGDCPFDNWLMHIATNVCLKLLRTKKGKGAQQQHSLDDPATLAGVEARVPAAEFEGEVVSRVSMHQVIRRILECGRTARPPWDALDLDVVELYYKQGVTSKREVARRLGESESTIKYRITYHITPVIARVRRELEAEDSGV